MKGAEAGIIFVLRNVNQDVNILGRNQLHPFYLVYVGQDGSVIEDHLSPKDALDTMRLLCRGKDVPDDALCKAFNKRTRNGKDMRWASGLLVDAIASIVELKAQGDVDSFFSSGVSTFLENDINGLDDFELICFLVVSE